MSRRVHTCIGGLIFCVGAVLLSLSFQGRVEAVQQKPPPIPCHINCDINCSTLPALVPCSLFGTCLGFNPPPPPVIICVGCSCQAKLAPPPRCWCYR